MSKLQININASSLRDSACLLSWYRHIVEGYVEPTFTSKVIYGIAVHKFLDTMYQTGDMKMARDAGLSSFRQEKVSDDKAPHMDDQNHFIWTCLDVWNNYAVCDGEYKIIQKPDGKPATEVTFSILFYEDDVIRVNLCGTIDKIGKIVNGCWAIGDWKTTGTWNKDAYLDGYAMSSQLRFYVLSLKLMHRFFPDSQLGQIGGERVGAFIDGIFLKPKPIELVVKRSDVFQFKDEDLASFEKSLVKRIVQLSQAIHDGTVSLKEGILTNTCERKYYKCPFYTVCSATNPQLAQMLLKKHFIQRPYDPLNRDKI